MHAILSKSLIIRWFRSHYRFLGITNYGFPGISGFFAAAYIRHHQELLQ